MNGVVGDDFAVLLDFNVDLTGYTFQARILLDNQPSNRYQTITVTNTNLAEGRITLSLSDAQTQALGPLSNRKWFITWSQGSDIRTVLSGNFTLNSKWAVTDYSPTTSDQTVVIQTPTVEVEVIGGVGGAVVWGDIQGDIEDQTDLIAYLNEGFLPWSNDIVLVTEGDSITQADGVNCWPVYLSQMSYLNGRVTLHNSAVGGSDIQDAIDRYPTAVYPYRPAATGAARSIFMPLMGANNTPIVDAEVTFDLLAEYIQMAVDDGFEVWICTMLHNYNDNAQADRFRLLVKQYRLPVMFLDTASVLPNYSNLAMFSDSLHPTNQGQQCLAAYINNALFAFGSIPNQNGSLAGQNQFEADIRDGIVAADLRATQNIRLQNRWLSNDGNSRGISVADNGTVNFGRADINVPIQSFFFGEGQKFRLLPNFDTYSFGWYNSRGIDGEVWLPLSTVGAFTIGDTSVSPQNIILRANGNATFVGTITSVNTPTTSTANQYLRKNASNTGYEYGNKTDYLNTTPTTGQTVSFNDNPVDQFMRINPAGDLADLTVDIPSNATSINTQKVVFMCTKNIANLVLTGATTIFNAPVSINAGDCFQFYKSASDEWTRVIT